ncbi:MAG: hypothetical protein JO353_00130, partial [Phycisphaerae bacterium]|nr:hypothetical protein [Phycisphaerae bacterium]
GQNGDSSDNQAALAIAQLGDKAATSLNGQSINQAYEGMVNVVATQAQSAANNATSTADVQTTLQNQRENLSGVDLNEETVNLMKAQRAFQGSARVITTINTMMDELMHLIV